MSASFTFGRRGGGPGKGGKKGDGTGGGPAGCAPGENGSYIMQGTHCPGGGLVGLSFGRGGLKAATEPRGGSGCGIRGPADLSPQGHDWKTKTFTKALLYTSAKENLQNYNIKIVPGTAHSPFHLCQPFPYRGLSLEEMRLAMKQAETAQTRLDC